MEVACVYQKKEFELYICYISSPSIRLLCVYVCVSRSVVSDSLQPHGL